MKDRGKFTAGVIGLAVGDALGMPYETGKRGDFDIYADTKDKNGDLKMTIYKKGMPARWYEEGIPAGTWTDDTAMTLAEIESIARLKKIDTEDIMNNFCRWHYEGEFSATGVSIGQGRLTVAALERYKAKTPAEECVGTLEKDNGDGSLMRMFPFVFCEDAM